jgi:hypothetical protein
LGALAAQLLHARSDHRKVVSGAGPTALAAQLLHACPDHRKVVSGVRSGHVSSVFLWVLKLISRRGNRLDQGVIVVRLTTRALPGQQLISSGG